MTTLMMPAVQASRTACSKNRVNSVAFRFKPNAGVHEELTRIAQERVHIALQHMENLDEDPVHAIHQARRQTKMLRALFRLARAELEAQGTYKLDYKTVRQAAKNLSSQRDSDVALKTLAMLCEETDIAAALSSISKIEKKLTSNGTSPIKKKVLRESAERFVSLMEQQDSRIASWKPQTKGKRTLQRGWARTYQDARDGMMTMLAEESAKTLHAWRKHVKYHHYHIRLLGTVALLDLSKRRRKTAELERCLGEHHDLVVLNELLDDLKGIGKKDLAALRTAISSLLTKKEKRAVHLGDVLFSRKQAPSLFK